MNVVPDDLSIEAIIPNETDAVSTVKAQNSYSQYYEEWGQWYPEFEFDVCNKSL